MNKIENLKSMSIEELRSELESTELLYQEMQYKHHVAALADVNSMKVTRKNIARINTEIRSRELSDLEQKGELQRDRIRTRRKKQKKNSKK